MSLTIYHNIQQKAIQEAQSVERLLPHFVRVTDVDDSPDLTDIHPRDRKDIDLHFISVDDDLFPETKKLIASVPEINDAVIIGFGPQSQLHPHVDTVELEPYAEINWVSVYIGMFVPSYDANKVAVKIEDKVHSHRDIIIFDTQIPHSAWNWTDEWWISIRLSVLKSSFTSTI